MARPLNEVFSAVEISRKSRYHNEKYPPRSLPEDIRRVSKNLFNTRPEDIEDYIAMCRTEMAEVNASRNKTYGYDFQNDKPSDGSPYIWVAPTNFSHHGAPLEPVAKKPSPKFQSSKISKEKTQSNKLTSYGSMRRKRTYLDGAASAKTTKVSSAFKKPSSSC